MSSGISWEPWPADWRLAANAVAAARHAVRSRSP